MNKNANFVEKLNFLLPKFFNLYLPQLNKLTNLKTKSYENYSKNINVII